MRRASAKNVGNTFIELLRKNGRTTSLDVKKTLREKDYFAMQSFVSNVLKNLFENQTTDFKFKFEDNGVYRTYVLIEETPEVKTNEITQEELDEINNNFFGLIYVY